MRLRLTAAERPSLVDRAAALAALASLLRGGLTVTAALQEWHLSVPDGMRPGTERAGRLVRLGATPREAIEAAATSFGDDTDALRAALDLHAELGADPIPMLERAAEMVRRRADSDAAGRAAAAGAKLSGWMVGGLPLVSLPLLPMARAPLLDPAGLSLLFLGLSLTSVGMFWMSRLVPSARPADEPTALFADHVAASLHAGASLGTALDVVSRHPPETLRSALARARRRVRLGESWPGALAATDREAFAGLVATLQRAQRLGASPSSALEAFARSRRAVAARAFEREVRRAPVLMVLPLVLCVLPAFGLLALVPFLRGLTLG